MLKIGITGGIGSGKTTVCKVFEVLGIPIFYADVVAKQIMYTDKTLREQIQLAFGTQAYAADGQLDKKYIAHIVFADPKKLEALNAIVHPAVFAAFDEWAIQQTDAPYVAKEAALLFESGSHKMCDYTILVQAPLDLKVQRIMQRDSISEDEVHLRMSRQLTDEEKQPMANFTIVNDEQKLLVPQIINLHEHFLKLHKRA